MAATPDFSSRPSLKSTVNTDLADPGAFSEQMVCRCVSQAYEKNQAVTKTRCGRIACIAVDAGSIPACTHSTSRMRKLVRRQPCFARITKPGRMPGHRARDLLCAFAPDEFVATAGLKVRHNGDIIFDSNTAVLSAASVPACSTGIGNKLTPSTLPRSWGTHSGPRGDPPSPARILETMCK